MPSKLNPSKKRNIYAEFGLLEKILSSATMQQCQRVEKCKVF